MATNLIATGDTAANSADFTLASGETASIVIRGAAGLVEIFVEQKDEAGAYHVVGTVQDRSRILTGPGEFRVRRPAGKTCGVFRG